jgi:hypothetical protein
MDHGDVAAPRGAEVLVAMDDERRAIVSIEPLTRS